MLTFSINKTTEEVFEAYSEIGIKEPKTDSEREWFAEAFLGVLDDRVCKDIDLKVYACGCERNTRIAKSKREVNIFNEGEEENKYSRGISERYLPVRDSTEEVDNRSEHESVIEVLEEYCKWFMVEEGVDIYTIISLSWRGNKDSIATIRYLKEKYKEHRVLYFSFPELLYYVIENVRDLNEVYKEKHGHDLIKLRDVVTKNSHKAC